MAGQLNARKGHKRLQKNASINVTPFVDLMLVLLIIFMVAAPQMTVNLPVELPQAAGSAASSNDAQPLVLSMTKDEAIFLEEQEVTAQDLIIQLNEASQNNLSQKIIIRGDQGVNYGAVIALVSMVNEAGYQSIALDAQQKN